MIPEISKYTSNLYIVYYIIMFYFIFFISLNCIIVFFLVIKLGVHVFIITYCQLFKNVLYLTMDNDVTAYRMAIGLFYCRSCLVSKKCLFKSLRFLPHYFLLLIVFFQKTIQTLPSILKVIFIDPFEQNLSFTFFLLQLLLISNDVAENPGPDNKVSLEC